jgi:uncharacterized protein YdaU (DUF1376 family)
MKDPAFLFYSKDFYEATRTMLPKERACYIDLLIYQHQHEFIPNDTERIMLYCSGIDEATLKAVLQAKFKLCDKGYYNQRLSNVVQQRKEFSEKQSDNGSVGQFFKKAKIALKSKEYNELKDFIYNVYGKENLLIQIRNTENSEALLEAMLQAKLKHLAIVNETAIENDIKDNVESPIELHFLQRFIIDKLKNVKKIPDQLTPEQCEKLIKEYGAENVKEKLLALENYRDIKKYTNLYLTLRTWCKPKEPKQEIILPYHKKN